MEFCIYLRKSRADIEAEQRGEGETLARHEAALLELAKRQRLNVVHIYREVVSGETIAARPVMQQLLTEVEQGRWSGVLVMEIERLARGDTIDQGIMAQAFRFSNTLIITPMKTYDPSNEFDEEYFEFGLFMSRREYNTINRRLQRGRLASVREGKYVGNKAPYGYNRVKIANDKGFTLEIDPEKAGTIELIYDLFINGELQEDGSRRQCGSYLISRRLNDMKIPSHAGRGWTQATIRDILINPVYMGKIRWNWRKNVKQIVGGERVTKRPRQSLNNCELIDGIHEAIIPETTWKEAQRIMAEHVVPATPRKHMTKNPLSGLIICGKCGRRMCRRVDSRGKNPPSIICAATSCDNVSSYLHYVEDKIMLHLNLWLEEYKIQLDIGEDNPSPVQVEAKTAALRELRDAIANVKNQLDNLHDLLEQGVYDTVTFLERTKILTQRKQDAENALIAAERDLHREQMRIKSRSEYIPKVEKLLTTYYSIEMPLERNKLLKEVLEKVVYVKETGSRWHGNPDDFSITLYPRINSEIDTEL